MLRALAVAAGMAFLVACGSSKSEDLLAGRPQQTNSSEDETPPPAAPVSDAGNASGDAGSANADAATGPAHDAGPVNNCLALRTEVDRLRPDAINCSLTAMDLQCAKTVDDVCCKLWVTSADSTAVKKFSDAVDKFKDAKCNVNCANVACTDGPTLCTPVSGARGTCAQ
jgi:hypothetical protein